MPAISGLSLVGPANFAGCGSRFRGAVREPGDEGALLRVVAVLVRAAAVIGGGA